METEGTRIKYAKKIYSPPRETPKKKKQPRKESESKPPVQSHDITETKFQEQDLENKAKLAQYVYKLRYQLDTTKKQLKSEEAKFKDVMKSLCTHFGSQDENITELLNWTKTSQAVNSEEINKSSGFEKLFLVHKFQIPEKKIDFTHEQIQEITQKPRSKSTKNKDASGIIKINLKDIDAKASDLTKESLNKEGKPSKKKKNPPPTGDESEEPAKKKKVKKNKENNETSQRKDTEDKQIILSPIRLTEKDNSMDFDNKIKKAEDTIHKYEELAHPSPSVHPLDMSLSNNIYRDGMKYMQQQGKNDVHNPHMLTQQLFGDNVSAMLGGLDMVNQSKFVEDLIKMGMQDPLLRSMAPSQDMINYYQRNYKS